MFQPDGAAVLTWKKRSYLVTANEGSTRFFEDARGNNVIDGETEFIVHFQVRNLVYNENFNDFIACQI